MGRPSQEQIHRNVHQEALRQFDDIQTTQRFERLQCLEDRRFYSIAGAQWEGSLGQQFENKPRFEVNKIHLSVIRIINEYRNNRIDVNFVSKEGADGDELADTCNKLYRADEQDSSAEEAKDNAFEEAVGGGFGAWRLRTCYEDEEDDENEKQRIRFEPIFDADNCVFFDLNAKKQDKSDARYCYVLTGYTREAYIEEFGDDPSSWPKDITQRYFDWYTPDLIFVAEYYKVVMQKETVHVYQGLDGQEVRHTDAEFEADEELEEVLLATGFRKVREKKIKRKRVHKYLLSGGGILEDCGVIAGNCIPIVPVYGKRWFVDGIERCMGHVRLGKDPQRLKNMQLSKLGEISALGSVEKPIVTPEQMAGHAVMWSRDNIENYPYLLLNGTVDANGNPTPAAPMAYTKAPEIPQPLAALLQITEADLKEILGNQEMGEKMISNIAEETVSLIQAQLGLQSFIYISNFAKAVKRSGEIWLSMAREVYVEDGRKMKGIGNQNELTTIELMKPKVNENHELTYANDIMKANFDVAVEVGPSSTSRRQATVRTLMGMMKIIADPQDAKVIGAMIMMNMEGEGVTEVREYYRNMLLRMGVVKPTDEEKQQLAAEQANAKPDPNTEYLQAAAEQARSEGAQAKAKTVLTIAQAKETEAKTAATLAEITMKQRQNIVDTMGALGEMLGNRTIQ